MNEKKYMMIRAEGFDDQLAVLAQFLKTVQHCGSIGHTTTLHLWYDGDGAARMKFDFGEVDVSGVEVPAEGKDGYKFYID